MTPLISGIASVASLLFNASNASARAAPKAEAAATPERPVPSARVTLSAQAQATLRAAGQGVRADALPAGITAADTQRPVSTQDFRKLLSEFGATEEEQATLTAGFDADGNGSVSANEFLQGLARASASGGAQGGPQGEAFTQSLLQLVDRRGEANGVVSQSELAGLTTAFAGAQAMRRA